MPWRRQYGRISCPVSGDTAEYGGCREVTGRDGLAARQVGDVKIRDADPAHFAFLLQFGHLRPAFLDVRIGVRPVDLVQVDDVQLQTPQAVFAFATDGIGFQNAANVARLIPHPLAFGEYVRKVGAARQGARHDLLGMAQAVNGGRIDPVHASVQGCLDGRDGFVIVLRSPGEFPASAAHRPCTDADGREVHITVA